MKKIVVLCGGTGSIALQKGFDELYDINNYQIDLIINAYDNGKSTGVCRKIFNNKILGPSDLRKNQLTYFSIKYKNELLNPDSYEYKMYELFELRLSAKNYEDYYKNAKKIIKDSVFLEKDIKKKFNQLINYFFFSNFKLKQWRKGIKQVDFTDFSLSNIFYASCAALHNNSLEYAGKYMAKILRIPNRVHLISNISLMLKAISDSGKIIEDEGDIVTWDNPKDKIKSVFLEKDKGEKYTPYMNENNQFTSCDKLILDADILIISSGTQWSSLIPTYMHKGCKDVIKQSKAKKYLIMNNCHDHDMYGVSATECLNILNNYLDINQFTIVINDNAEQEMNIVDQKYKQLHGELSEKNNRKHSPKKLVSTIMKHYFSLNSKLTFISDLDGTLWSDVTEQEKRISIENLKIFEGIIFSGNSYNHVKEITDAYFVNKNNNYIYCDYGNTYFRKDKNKETLSKEFYIEESLLNDINQIPDFKNKCTIRGNTILTIKPLIDRSKKLVIVNEILKKYDGKYQAYIAGRTSIDIVKGGLDKSKALRLLLAQQNLDFKDIIYLGNEIEYGNETCIKSLNVLSLQVNDVFEMNMLLKTLYF